MEYLRIGVDDDAKGITEQILEFIKVEKNDAIEYKYRKNTKKLNLII